MPLRPDEVDSAVKASAGNPKFTRIKDGHSLYLMTRNGRGYWSFMYKQNSKLRTEMLGTTANLSPIQARKARDRFNVWRDDGFVKPRRGAGRSVSIDTNRSVSADTGRVVPADTTRAKPGEIPDRLFADVLTDFLSTRAANWRGTREAAEYRRTLGGQLGSMLVGDIETPEVEHHLAQWANHQKTRKKVQTRLHAVLEFAKAKGLRTGDNPARWKGHLENLIPRAKKKADKHHDAMDAAAVPFLMKELIALGTPAARALGFTILSAGRTEEIREMKWSEIQGGVWSIDGSRMKQGREHSVPLTPQALKLLGKPGAAGGYVFKSVYGNNKPLGTDAMLKLLKTLRPDTPATVHGFRSTFRDWVGDETDFPRDHAELSLAHKLGDAVESAYARRTQFAKRRKLMLAWSAFCSG
jgi:integrase